MILARRPGSDPLDGLRGGAEAKIQLFQNIVMLHIKLNGITNAATWYQIFCPQTPVPHDPVGRGQKVKLQLFSEHDHAAYQIKLNHECSNMVANILPTDLPPPLRPLGWGQNVPTTTNIPPTQGVGSKGQNSTFSEYSHVAFQIKWNDECSNMVANILPQPPPPLRPLGWGQKVKIHFSGYGHVAYQIKGSDTCRNMAANILPADSPSRPWGWDQ